MVDFKKVLTFTAGAILGSFGSGLLNVPPQVAVRYLYDRKHKTAAALTAFTTAVVDGATWIYVLDSAIKDEDLWWKSIKIGFGLTQFHASLGYFAAGAAILLDKEFNPDELKPKYPIPVPVKR